MVPASARRGPPTATASFLARGFGLLSFGLLSEGLVRDAAAQRQEMETQERREEVAPCRIVSGETAVPAGRTQAGACARAIQAGSGTGTWGPYELEVDRDGWVHINGEYVGMMREAGDPAEDPRRR
jgi:hypothetical protein